VRTASDIKQEIITRRRIGVTMGIIVGIIAGAVVG